MKRLFAYLPLAAYLALVALSGVPSHQDGPSLPPAPWEELR